MDVGFRYGFLRGLYKGYLKLSLDSLVYYKPTKKHEPKHIRLSAGPKSAQALQETAAGSKQLPVVLPKPATCHLSCSLNS